MFDEIKKETFDEREKRILEFWESNAIFERSVTSREKSPHFASYDGPPFATGLPHYGHFLAGTIKDVVFRYKTMKNFYAPRRFGWDCHGLPVEFEVEKAKNLSGSASIEAFGIANFNEECRKIVFRYSEEWKDQVKRMGRWVDFKNTYHTMDITFMESVWWVFKQLWNKELVYEGFKVMPYSAKLGTPLSNFEAGENYREVDDPSLVVAFQLVDEDAELLVWTTTPWTLPSNLAIAVQPSFEYVKVLHQGKKYVLAKKRLPEYFKEGFEIIETFTGNDLVGKKYVPLFDYFKKQDAFRVIPSETVTVDDGTGLVHTAPAFGEDDFYACQKAGIPLVCPVDGNGQFTKEVPEYEGKFVKDADKDIIKRLKQSGNVFHHTTFHHRYPFCWRSDTPLIYKAVSTWFVAVEKIKDKMVRANQEIHWCPEHLKEGRFGKWLEGARDWAISRNRYWGTPIPIWRAEDGEIHVVESIAELEQLTGEKITDLHRHFIDHLTFEKNGKTFKRILEVFDCWFESGSMPYAENHYPFENKEAFQFPADFIAEGIDQTRGWFYTLTVLAAALFDKPAFKNVIVNGIVLAADGAKMSKRLKNYPDPMLVVSKYGADAIRLYMMHSGAVKAEDLRFVESGVELILRQILIPFWNAYSFFITYARIYKWEPRATFENPDAEIDRWILSAMQNLIYQVENGMNNYNLSQAVEPFIGFIDQLTDWYIRRSRRRFWESEATKDRDQAFATLYQVLVSLSQIAAPYIPFLSEAIYRNLRTKEMAESVHLSDFPKFRSDIEDKDLEASMAAVQATVSLGHSLRKEHKLKVRQPLAKAHIASSDEQLLAFLKKQQHLIGEELNVKEVEFVTDETQFVSLQAKPNFRVLGKKVGKSMRLVQEIIATFDKQQLQTLQNGGNITIQVEGADITLTSEDVAVERSVHEGMIALNSQAITVALDTTLTDELLLEGLAREIVNKINTMRRDGHFDVVDRIHVTMQTTARVQECLKVYGDSIKNEILALSFTFGECQGEEWDLNGELTTISLQKVSP